jgi:acetyltransferase-like isoleucine patch superfamily enzyme
MLHCIVTANYQDRLQAHGIRALRLHGNILINPGTVLEAPGYIGGLVNLATTIKVGAFTLINGGRITEVSMGRYCSIAGDVTFGGAEHPLDRITTTTITYAPGFHDWDKFYDTERSPEFRARVVRFAGARRLTTLGHDVWIGFGATIKAGISIGTGAVIGAGAVVTKDVPPYAIITGIPGRIRRYRFPEAQIERLLRSRWWDYAIYDLLSEKIKDVDAFCDDLEEKVAAGHLKPYAPAPLDAAALCEIIGGSPPSQ